jgi:AraC-like DNA-binding protein
MSAEPGSCRVAAERTHLPPMPASATLHWDGIMRRIERAKRLLRETEWPIIDIGHHVGFTDQSYFTAVFRKHVTTTPKRLPRRQPTIVAPKKTSCSRSTNLQEKYDGYYFYHVK